MTKEPRVREKILSQVREYWAAQWGEEKPFVPGETPIPVSGKVFDADDVSSLVDASLDFWLTTGRFAQDFERRLAKFVGVRHAMLCNSGSSANLVALSALTSSSLGDRALTPGDEVLTVAAGFPTTINPIIQNGCVPVFVDTLPAFYVLAIIFGVAYGGVMPLYAALVRDTFGPRIMGTMFGAVTMFASLGMALGPGAGGFVFDIWGDYSRLYVGSFIVGLCAVAIALTFRPARYAASGQPLEMKPA